MIIDNAKNYCLPGTWENVVEPKTTGQGDTAFLLSNYTGLYGVAVGKFPHVRLLMMTDSYDIARKFMEEVA